MRLVSILRELLLCYGPTDEKQMELRTYVFFDKDKIKFELMIFFLVQSYYSSFNKYAENLFRRIIITSCS